MKATLKRLNDATRGGVVGMFAGKVKKRDEIITTAAIVLIALQVVKAEGLIIGFAVGIAIAAVCGLLIRLWKWRLGVPRDSIDY
ncbi:MAG TPA: hypothetical protein VFU16_02040 [Solirubrobacterales bacterium]|nr:hypothetical protein [Solirubrobacterales bacterium]